MHVVSWRRGFVLLICLGLVLLASGCMVGGSRPPGARIDIKDWDAMLSAKAMDADIMMVINGARDLVDETDGVTYHTRVDQSNSVRVLLDIRSEKSNEVCWTNMAGNGQQNGHVNDEGSDDFGTQRHTSIGDTATEPEGYSVRLCINQDNGRWRFTLPDVPVTIFYTIFEDGKVWQEPPSGGEQGTVPGIDMVMLPFTTSGGGLWWEDDQVSPDVTPPFYPGTANFPTTLYAAFTPKR